MLNQWFEAPEMGKFSSLVSLGCLIGLTLWGLPNPPALAQNCTENCPSGQIQVTPGDRISVQIVNSSSVTVAVEQVPLRGPITLPPGARTQLGFGWGTTPNLSMFIWALTDQPIRYRLGRTGDTTLTVEVVAAPSEPSDRSIYIENDGRVTIK
jgi:hypothetical protein